MANIFEYIVRLKDQASAAADKIKKALDSVPQSVERINVANAAMSSRAIHAFERVRNAARQLSQTVVQAGKTISQKVSEWRSDFFKSLPGANLITNPLALAGAATGGFWLAAQKAMDAGKEKMKLQVLTGSDEIGATLYDSLTKYATDTVFGNELYGMATQMLANGIRDSDVMPVMKQLGDISMGDSEKLGQLSLAFAQINGKGHLAGQELLQLINGGFNPLQVISEKTGETMESLQKRMSKGEISINDVRMAMDIATGPGGKFNDMLQKVANTPYGQLKNLEGQLSQMMIEIGQVFIPIATKFMNIISWIGEKMGPYLKPVVIILASMAVGLLAVAAAQWAWNSALFAIPIVALIGVIVYVISLLDGWGNAWNNLMSGMRNKWNAFTSSFKLIWLGTVDAFMRGIELIQKGWYKVKSLWDSEGANKGLKKLNDEAEQRSRQIAYQKGLTETYNKIADDAFGNVLGKNGLHRNSATLSGTVNKIKDAVLPGGANPTGAPVAPGDKTKPSRDAVATGGTKNTTINIQIGKQIESLTVVSNNLKEGAMKIRDIIVEEMTRAAGMAGALAG